MRCSNGVCTRITFAT
ncbi:hypothetical protein D049_3922A, partial [Vibrio parahaemolyticus VPTS-2010]